MLIVEFTFVLWIRGITIRDYLAAVDPISGGAYYSTLLIFAILPLLVGNAKNASDQ